VFQTGNKRERKKVADTRQTGKERASEREKERQRDRETERQRDRETDTHAHTGTDKQTRIHGQTDHRERATEIVERTIDRERAIDRESKNDWG